MRVMVALVCAFALAGCSESGTEAPPASPRSSGEQVTSPSLSAANAGVVAVRVSYAGPPDIETVSVNKDVKQCGEQARIGRIVVGEGQGLANAVASVAGLEASRRAKPATSPRTSGPRPTVDSAASPRNDASRDRADAPPWCLGVSSS